MKTATALQAPSPDKALRDTLSALKQVEDLELPKPLVSRMRSLFRRKEKLSEVEKRELAALVDIADDKALERLQAKAALRALRTAFPTLSVHSSEVPVST